MHRASPLERSGHRALFLGAMFLASLLARPAGAASQLQLHPSVILSGGVDDNLLFNGTGGDKVGRGGVGLDLKGWDRLWSVSFQAGLSVYGFAQRQRIVPLGETTLNGMAELGRWDKLNVRVRARGSDDPLGLAQIGLLGAAGNVLGYRSTLEYEHGFDARWSLATVFNYSGVAYFDDLYSDRSGSVVGLGLEPRFQLTRDLSFHIEASERTFLSRGLQGYSINALPGVRYRIARRFFAEAEVGPALFHDAGGYTPLPVGRGAVEYDERYLGARLTVSHDLGVPNGRAGVLLMDIVEGMVRWGSLDWEIHGRTGYYRSLASIRAEEWQPGYGLQAEVHRRLASFVWIGLSALRFERLATQFQPGMARNAIYLQLDLTQGRP